ncbi:PREDICTED: cytokine receptor-like isoform X1 [Rhagoletis zephyria]|uniref:cytokine receptor-like isoform X1 n=2 Tax=Rhagoletis zephyria TaxID=28612 RepID=UPI000811AA66|nr:PREDICTED: cytokine receptor-like isoform X1 [Rhagoletis zephyria]
MNFRCLLLTTFYCFYTQCIILNVYAQSPGETSPTIVMEIGDSANITCRMNLKRFGGKNSSTLYFTTEDPKYKTTPKNIVVLNATTIVYTLQNASEQYTTYTCKSGQYAIASTDVIVGTKPLPVADFSCQAYDFIYMTCSFTIPANMIPTTYNLKYVTQNANYILNCIKLVKEGDRASCNFTLDDGSYKPNFEYYKFRLQSNNTLGALEQNFTVNHKEIVKPAISDFHVDRISTHGCMLIWEMERYSSYKLSRLQMEVHLHSPDYESLQTYTCNRCNNHSIFHLPIGNLPYSYYQYNVSLRIKMRMPTATWSDPYSIDFQTLPSAPEVPPAVDVSSFYLNATHLRLFWYPTPEYHRNGSNFHYIVKQMEETDVAVDQPPLHIQVPTVAFPWNNVRSYIFEIRSSNEQGVSLNSSQIRIPSLPKNYDNRTPLGIRNVYHALQRTYTLLWNSPEDSANVESYTVFWCKPKSVASNECHNVIGFRQLNRNARNFKIQQSQPLVLAVAANYPDFYTGMHWAKCTADVSNDLEKLEPEIVEKKAYSITVRWSSERVCASLIKGYTITYCKTKSATKLKCLDKTISISVDKNDNKFEITNLEPDSTYKMEMVMYSDVQSGPISDELVLQTNEAAPTSPRNLTYERITSQSVVLRWLSPYISNGRIRYYVILYNGESHILYCNNTIGSHCLSGSRKSGRNEHLFYTLGNLSSFTNYTICVKAYTVAHSLPSNCVHIQTLIGVPSSPSHTKFDDSKDIVIRWRQPEVPSGRVDYYEVIVETKLGERIESRHISRITNGMQCTIRKPRCYNSDFKYTIGVRGVNIAYFNEIDANLMHIQNNSHMHDIYVTSANDELGCVEAVISPLHAYKTHIEYRSVEVIVFNYVCGTVARADGKLWITIFVSILGSSLIVMAGLLTYRRCHEMASIECKIPEHLNDLVNRNDSKLGEQDMERVEHSIKQQYYSENGRLLPSISKDSEYSNDGSGYSWPTTKSSYYESSENAGDYCIHDPMTLCNTTQSLETVQEITAGYTVMTTPNTNVSNTVAEVDSGYVHPNALQPNVTEKPFTINWPMGGEDGYIHPNNRQSCNWQQETNNVHNANTQANANNAIYLPTVR